MLFYVWEGGGDSMYMRRDIEKILLKAAESFQVITLFGSRQVGKTTTADHLFGDEFGFVTLDDSDELILAHNNPKGFFESHPWPLIIDEVQKEPCLLSEIKRIVDEQRRIWMRNGEQRKLMFVLTGSNQFELQEGISESLAGRTAVINMAGFTQMEKRGIEGSLFEVDFESSIAKQHAHPDFYKSSIAVFEDIFQGGMPDVCTGESERNTYYKAYVDTYIEKDVRKFISASSEMQFRRFIEILALRTAQELVYSDISRDLGINVDTCKRWISILQTSGIIYLLQPYMSNMSKRIIKSPKLYFMDTGLCSFLCKWPSAEMLRDGIMNGAFFETYVVSEVIKSFLNNGVDPAQYLYYYRDIDKKEVDILLVKEGTLYPVEVKKGISPTKPTKNFTVLKKYEMPIARGMVIDNTDAVRAINDKAFCFPVSLLGV
ncbi:MAG: ATP-binding protein [Eubacteriaceae bacterium]|nr:ATP-binding protein [Eubacteriaceae bacterium]